MGKDKRRVLVAGHIGVGHVHSYGGLVQDDSLGFASVITLIRKFYDVDLRVRKLVVESPKKVCVETTGGGVGCATPSSGFTEFEIDMLRQLEGSDASIPHLSVLKVFGRMHGGGCSEASVAVEYALAEAALDTLARNIPGFAIVKSSDFEDVFGGISIELEEGDMIALLSVNGFRRGIGPAEDLEGNVPLGHKKMIMETLGATRVPSIVIESKAYIPLLSDRIAGSTVLLRYNIEYDNIVVAREIAETLKQLGIDFLETSTAFPRYVKSMVEVKKSVLSELISTASALSSATAARDKVRITEQLVKLVCRDLGGVFFMSDDLIEVVGSAGLVPGTGAVVSIAVDRGYIENKGLPYATPEESSLLAEVAVKASRRILTNYEEAMRLLEERYIEISDYVLGW
ncbi:MAG: hypothetical protein QW583_00965 [Sulfolobales archaeon]